MNMRGSYTVEAAIIVPIMLFSMIVTLQIGIFLFEEIKNESKKSKSEELWEVECFYNYQMIKGVLHND